MKERKKVNEESWHPLTRSYGIQDLAAVPGGSLQLSVVIAHRSLNFFQAGGDVHSTLDYRNYWLSAELSQVYILDPTVSLANLHESFFNKSA